MKTTIMAFVLGITLSEVTVLAKETRDCAAKSANSLWAKTNPTIAGSYNMKPLPRTSKNSSARQAKSAQ